MRRIFYYRLKVVTQTNWDGVNSLKNMSKEEFIGKLSPKFNSLLHNARTKEREWRVNGDITTSKHV